MFKLSLAPMMLTSFIAATLGFDALAAQASPAAPVYFPDGQYSAALQQSAHRWQLRPMQGDYVDVIERASTCASAARVPNGMWIVTHDNAGQPQLLAVSATVLPPGFPGQLQLRICGDDGDRERGLFVPAVVFDWINHHVGAVLIDD